MVERNRSFATMISSALLAGLVLGEPAHAQTGLGFTNGSFESGVSGPTSPFTSSTGWNSWLGPASGGSNYGVAMSSAPPKVAEDGSFYAYFHATQNVLDCIGQQLNTVVGQKYSVSFWLATDGPTDATTSQMEVVWGPDFAQSLADVIVVAYQQTSAAAVPYQHMTRTFTATTTHDILAFHGYNKTSAFLLDNVTVNPVVATSVPASRPGFVLLMAALMTGAAFASLRRGRGAGALRRSA